jgi:hypothetical protein
MVEDPISLGVGSALMALNMLAGQYLDAHRRATELYGPENIPSYDKLLADNQALQDKIDAEKTNP